MEIARLSEILRESGIVGAGGAGFPTYGKLSDKADTILMNCAECEPLLKLHRQLLGTHAREIMQAFALIGETVGAKEMIIGIKKEYKGTIAALHQYIDEFPGMRIHELPGAYPMGDEVVLIYEATGRVVCPGGLPIECGVAVFNVETLWNVYRAVWEQRPVTEKYVTVVGEVEHPVTVRVPVGISIGEVTAMAGAVTVDDPVYLLGGPMMGNFGQPDQPVTKTTNAIIVLSRNHPLVLKKQSRFSIDVARAAREKGMQVVVGATNVLMGRSHSNNLSAREAIREGCADILVSDYFPPALLHAVFRLWEEGMLTLPQAVNMTSRNPARAVGIGQWTGSIEEGKCGDLLVVGKKDGLPVILQVFINGQMVSNLCYRNDFIREDGTRYD